MRDWPRWLRRALGILRVAVVTPVGPGHAELYAECRASVEAAWRCGRGPFSTIDFIAVDDSNGRLGRSRARNLGIDRALAQGADWLFFLDADDLMVEGAFAAAKPFVAGHDAVWGLILGLAPDAARPHLRIPQVVGMNTLDDLLLFDPFLTLQMGHFVRAPVAAVLRFDEAMDAGEDYDYYLRMWSTQRCAKVAREFFINRHARHSTGPRAASAQDWGTAVRGRQRTERERRGLAPYSAAARAIRNARSAELQAFCRQQGLVNAGDCAALSLQMPYFGEVEVHEYDGDGFALHTENDDAICNELAWTGEYRPFACAVWQALAAGGDTILDVGAGSGFHALLAARVAPQARILCVETVAENKRRLRLNMDRNAVANVELIEALPAGTGAISLARIGAGSDALAALRDMQQLLAQQRPDLLIESGDAVTAGTLEAMLRPHGYRIFAIDDAERELRPLAAARTANDVLTVLASVRSAGELGRMAGRASGRLAGE